MTETHVAAASAVSRATSRPPRTRVDGWALAGIPGILLLAVFFILPLGQVLLRSVTDPGPENYIKILSSSGYVKILIQTFQIAGLVTAACLILGYPFAYLMTRVSGIARVVLIAVVLLPIWTSFLVRSVALQTWLQDTGVINTVLQSMGLISEPLPLIRTTLGVTIGMTQILLPFMILPLFSVMNRVRPDLMPAAASLGASPMTAFFRVYVPQTIPGAVSGSILVFVISLGFFIVPAILGGTEGTIVSKMIVDLVGKNQLGMASALAAILLVVTIVVLAIGSRFVRLRDIVSGGRPMTRKRPSVLLWIAGGVVAIFLAAPTLILIPMSFTDTSSLVFPPKGFSFRWYENFFASSQWLTAAGHSVTIGVLTMVLSILLGVPLAMSLVRSRYRGVGVVNALVLGPAVVPGVILAIGTFGFMTTLGLTRTLPGLVIAHTVLALPLVVISIMASAQTLDRNLELAASNLGASPLGVFRHAVLPALLPGIAIGAVYGFVTSWDEMIVSLFITGPSYNTLPVHMWNQVRNNSDPTTVAASTMLVVLSTFVLFLVFVVGRNVTNRRERAQK